MPMHRLKHTARPGTPRSRHTCISLVLAATVCSAHASPDERRWGDILSVAMPLATLGHEFVADDRAAAWQYTESLTASLAASEVLKRSTHVERPDKTNHMSFPSGHAIGAFASASFIHRRYGFENAWPAYGLATFVGYTRVHANRHRWGDVAGAAAVTTGMNWWLVTPKSQAPVAIIPEVGPRYAGVVISAQW